MELYRVHDLSWESVHSTEYDLAIFASGYEQRGVNIASRLSRAKLKEIAVVGFTEQDKGTTRLENDDFWQDGWVESITLAHPDDGTAIYNFLRTNWTTDSTIRILVDYSSMSRNWYACVLNWIRFDNKHSRLFVDFAYSAGRYEGHYQSLAVERITTVPGCEGKANVGKRSFLICGLGFDGWAPLALLDSAEPDEILAFVADPAFSQRYVKRAKASNASFLETYKAFSANDVLLEMPLSSVARSFALLAETVSLYHRDYDLALVPMGPKPHVLASILVCNRFSDVKCLRVSGKQQNPPTVPATGDVVLTRAEFRASHK